MTLKNTYGLEMLLSISLQVLTSEWNQWIWCYWSNWINTSGAEQICQEERQCHRVSLSFPLRYWFSVSIQCPCLTA